MNSTKQGSDKVMEREYTHIFETSGMKKYFPVNKGFLDRLFSREDLYVHAIDDINFAIESGEIFCLVGESGCGKTTTARVVNGLEEPTDGEFYWKDSKIEEKELKPKKDDIKSQIVFQNPYSSLNPRMKVGDAIQHPLEVHGRIEDQEIQRTINNAKKSEFAALGGFILSIILFVLTFLTDISSLSLFYAISGFVVLFTGFGLNYWFGRRKRDKIVNPQVINILEKVGLTPAIQFYHKYPHELSGGERQRVNIARSIILNPDLLILDEPTSMLDVSIRAGILDLLRDLQTDFQISILFITHDLATARHFADRVAVMYVGEIVEKGEVDEIFSQPMHPYSASLINAIPTPNPDREEYDLPKGDVADAINPPTGCRFHPRCPIAEEKCAKINPKLEEKKKDHFVACHFPLINENQD